MRGSWRSEAMALFSELEGARVERVKALPYCPGRESKWPTVHQTLLGHNGRASLALRHLSLGRTLECLTGVTVATLNIPPRYREAITKIQLFDDKAFEELRAALETQQPSSVDPNVVSAIASSTPDIAPTDVEGVLESLMGLQIARSLADASLEQFCDDVVSEIERGDKKTTQSPEQRAKFAARIRTLLQFDSLAVAAKSRDLQTDHEHVYLNGRIITDLRPVFRGTPDEAPAGILLHHTLRVTYLDRGSGERSSIYVAMDDDDLGNLKRLLERAEVKATTLRKQLHDAGIKSLGRSRA